MENFSKTSRILLPDDVRQVSTSSQVWLDTVALALRFYLNVTDASGSGGLQVVVRGYDKASGNAVELTTGGAMVTAPGAYCYEMTPYPSTDAFGAIVESASRAVPYQWDALVKHADSSNYRYSLSVEIVG